MEAACGFVAVLSSHPLRGIASISAALCCICLQAPTSAYQLIAVFGVKRLVVPMGVLVSVLHVCTALQLLVEPASEVHIERLMVALHWYALSRAMYEALARVWLPLAVRPHIYTISITGSGLMVTVCILGIQVGLACVALCTISFNLLSRGSCSQDLVHGSMPSVQSSRHLCVSKAAVPRHMSQAQIAHLIFDQLDADDSGKVDAQELSSLLVMWGLPAGDADEVVDSVDRDHDHQISFEEFTGSPITRAISEFAYKVLIYNNVAPECLLSERRVEPLQELIHVIPIG